MARKRSRELNVFSMSFLDAITAGFGAVVLLFMLVSQRAMLDSRNVVDDMTAEARRWELKVLTGQKNLVQIKEALQKQLEQWTALRALRQNLVSEIQDTQTKLGTLTEDSAARRAAIEQLRLGARLRLTWELDNAPVDALLPPLLLQPILENAVYHGIEPATAPGDVLVRIERRGDRVLARIENPYQPEHSHRAGNRMALANIRERLMLFFDAEARLDSRVEGARYLVEVEIPYRTGRTEAAP